jgi:hypothetical protein
MSSLESQKLADEHEPVSDSVHVLGGAVKKLSVVGREDQPNMEQCNRRSLKPTASLRQ